MKGDKINYRGGYKYSLWNTYTVKLTQSELLGHAVSHRLFNLTIDGYLTIYEDYPWDGPSGPTFDTPSTMRGSLVHDALYEMMRLGLLPQRCFLPANLELYYIALEDGMWRWRAGLWLDALNKCGHPAANPKPENIVTAP